MRRDSSRSFCSSSVSPLPSSTKFPACATTLKAMGATYTFGSPCCTAPPSRARPSMGASASTRPLTWDPSSATPARPLPDTAWNVVTRSARSPATPSSALRAGIAAIVVQFGLAMIPSGRSNASFGFTSETTSGTRGSLRHADELSITTAPACANIGA